MTEYNIWKTKAEGYWLKDLESLSDIKEIEERFGSSLDFGTGGIRGIIGSGTNRMNIYTVRRASKGLANYLNQQKSNNSIVISYDSRNFSYEFAHSAAEVFAASGFKVYIFSTLTPTPMLSYAVRQLSCDAGIMITASHNPKEYNGYKAYGADGCQLNLEQSQAVVDCMNQITDYFSIKTNTFEHYLKTGKIEYVNNDVYESYMAKTAKASLMGTGNKNIKIIYTPLNGTGNIPVRDMLRRRGYNNVCVVAEQEMPDGNFTTCPYPNPESEEALALAFKLAEKEKADLIIATDPDCDRMGMAVRHKGKYRMLTGNEIGILMADYLLSRRKALGTLPENPCLMKTIVTTDLIYKIAADYNAYVYDFLTGFKFIGEQLTILENQNRTQDFILGFEESYGYLVGDNVRDKDGIVASMLAAEICEYYKSKEMTAYDALLKIYEKYGYSGSSQKSKEFVGIDAQAKMNNITQSLRTNPPKTLGKYEVKETKDYLNGIDGLPPSDVFAIIVENGKAIVRPSGTEPKLKLYIMASDSSPQKLSDKINEMQNEMLKLLNAK